LQQWEKEYVKLYQQLIEERQAWEKEKNEGLLLLSDYRRDNQQLEIEKRQWEQEREFGFKLVENLRHRVDHYILKIQLIEKFYNIDIDKFDSSQFVNQAYTEGMMYDPNKIDYVNSDNIVSPNSTTNDNDHTNLNNTAKNVTSFLTISSFPVVSKVGNESVMSNASETTPNEIEELFEQDAGELNMFERKRQESEDLRKECQTLENELKELQRKQAQKDSKSRNSREENIDTTKLFVNSNKKANDDDDEQHRSKAATADDDVLLTPEEAQIMISESELVFELMDAWSTEVTTLLEQVCFFFRLEIYGSIFNNITYTYIYLTEANESDMGNDDATHNLHSKYAGELKNEDVQTIAQQVKTRMQIKSTQALEKHRYRRLQQQEEEDEENELAAEEQNMDGDEHDHDEDDRAKTQSNAKAVESEETSDEPKRYFSGQVPQSRIMLSKLSNRKDTELDLQNSPKRSTPAESSSISMLEQDSKKLLAQRAAVEMERMRGLLKSYIPDYRYRRILDRLIEDNRYQNILDKLADENYQPHELDALLAHIGHLKYQNKFK
ncbi:hypothetical protein RFI_27913, partial [Reticulomyxa filosa]